MLPMLILLGIVLFPYLRLHAEYPNIGRAIDDTARYGATLRDYATVLPTSWLSDLGLRKSINEIPLYPTATLLVLSFIGILRGWKSHKKYVVFFAVSGLAAFILSFGPYLTNTKYILPYYYLYKFFPVMQVVRVPARLSIMVIFSLAALAAIGISRIRTHRYIFSVIIFLCYVTEVWQVGTPSVPVPTQQNIPAVYAWITKLPDSVIIAEVPFKPKFSLEPMEMQLMHTYDETRDDNGSALETYRVYFSYFHKKRMLNGYSGYFPQTYQDNANALEPFATGDAVEKLKKEGVRYIVVHIAQFTGGIPANFPGLTEVKQFGSDYVYEIR